MDSEKKDDSEKFQLEKEDSNNYRNSVRVNKDGTFNECKLDDVVDVKNYVNDEMECEEVKDLMLYNVNLVSYSGKLSLLDRMLTILKNDGHKVLIFSQSTQMLDILEDFCNLKDYKYSRLDGSMNFTVRQQQMERFDRHDVFIFLLSTRAGGLGINLVQADTVIIYDSDWNPQCDLQAQDRCHRIGQTRPVLVMRFVTKNSIDEKIYERATAKRKLERMIIQKGKFKSSLKSLRAEFEPLSRSDLLSILKSDDAAKVVEADQDRITDQQLMHILRRD